MIYLDNAATTPVIPEVIDEITDVMKTIYGNPSSLHSIGELAHEVLVKSRKKIADYIGCLPTEIIFTSGACESNT